MRRVEQREGFRARCGLDNQSAAEQAWACSGVPSRSHTRRFLRFFGEKNEASFLVRAGSKLSVCGVPALVGNRRRSDPFESRGNDARGKVQFLHLFAGVVAVCFVTFRDYVALV